MRSKSCSTGIGDGFSALFCITLATTRVQRTYSRRCFCGCAFSTWLYQIARNACIDELRRRGVRAKAVQTVRQQGERRRDDWGQPGIAAANEERNRLLSQAIAKLDDKHREVIVLFFYNKLRYREIGEIVGCPEGTARSRVFYGLRELRRILPHETFRDYPGRSEQ